MQFSKVGRSVKGGNCYWIFAILFSSSLPRLVNTIIRVRIERSSRFVRTLPARRFQKISTSVFARVEMKFSPENRRERNGSPSIPTPAARFLPVFSRKKNRGCVRPMCFHSVNNNGESSAERISMPLLVTNYTPGFYYSSSSSSSLSFSNSFPPPFVAHPATFPYPVAN